MRRSGADQRYVLLRMRRYRCDVCRMTWRQDTSKAAAARAKIFRGGLGWALTGIVVDHLIVTRDGGRARPGSPGTLRTARSSPKCRRGGNPSRHTLSSRVPMDRRAERVGDLRQRHGRRDRQPELLMHLPDDPGCVLPPRDVHIQIHPVDTPISKRCGRWGHQRPHPDR